MSGDHLNHRNSPAAAGAAAAAAGDWQFGKPSMSMSMAMPNSTIPMYQGIQMASSSCPQVSVASDSFYPNPWNHPPDSQTSGFPENATAATANNIPIGKPIPLPPRLDMGMFLTTNPCILPPSLSDFPADSSFIERAAKFSNFSAGNFGAFVNPFGSSESLSPYSNASNSISGAQTPKSEVVKDGSMSIDNGSRCQSPMNNQRDNGSGREETPDMANVSGDSSSKGLNSKKGKKGSQDMELDQVQEGSQFSPEIPKENVETKQNVECSSSTPATGKSSGKNAKGSTDGAKQDYIHVRARRGQATNSHSLAERVRRERISERMKYLQDIVPGCSKVTGKAVMLDEIINYVQSLQRQVEFLSMKLASVNPRIDLNIEGLLSKEILLPRIGQSPMGFSPDLIHPQLLSSQKGLAQTGIPGMENHADALRRAVSAQFTAMNSFKEPTPQMSNTWEAELHNMVQMNFGTNPPPNTQEYNGKPHDGFPL